MPNGMEMDCMVCEGGEYEYIVRKENPLDLHNIMGLSGGTRRYLFDIARCTNCGNLQWFAYPPETPRLVGLS